MKTLIFSVSFVFAGFLSYGWLNTSNHSPNAGKSIFSSSLTDTIPKSRDSMNKKYGRDSLNKRDTSWPKRDSSGRQ